MLLALCLCGTPLGYAQTPYAGSLSQSPDVKWTDEQKALYLLGQVNFKAATSLAGTLRRIATVCPNAWSYPSVQSFYVARLSEVDPQKADAESKRFRLERVARLEQLGETRTLAEDDELAFAKAVLRMQEQGVHTDAAIKILDGVPATDARELNAAIEKINRDFPEAKRDSSFQKIYLARLSSAKVSAESIKLAGDYFDGINAETEKQRADLDQRKKRILEEEARRAEAARTQEVVNEIRAMRQQVVASEQRAQTLERRLNATQREVEYQRSRLNSVNQTFRDAGIQPGRSSFGP